MDQMRAAQHASAPPSPTTVMRCPACGARYEVPLVRLQRNQSVRCSACKAEWVHDPAVDASPPVRPWQAKVAIAAALTVTVAAAGLGVLFQLSEPSSPILERAPRPAADATPLPPEPPSLPLPLPAATPPLSLPPPVPWPAAEPSPVRSASAPPDAPLEPDPPDVARPGGPGLVLIAGPGDTMRSLYAQVYRGVQPPPFAEVAAANPVPVRPGATVLFPTPPSGWRP